MNIRNVALLSVMVVVPFGLGTLLMPAQFLAIYGVELSEAGLVMTRLFGVHLLTIAIVDWYARNDLHGAAQPGMERGIVHDEHLLANAQPALDSRCDPRWHDQRSRLGERGDPGNPRRSLGVRRVHESPRRHDGDLGTAPSQAPTKR